MTDKELARALECGRIDSADFKHSHHLHVAWAYLCESSSIEGAIAKMGSILRRFAASAGVPEKYHETMTAFWMRILFLLRHSGKGRSLQEWVILYP